MQMENYTYYKCKEQIRQRLIYHIQSWDTSSYTCRSQLGLDRVALISVPIFISELNLLFKIIFIFLVVKYFLFKPIWYFNVTFARNTFTKVLLIFCLMSLFRVLVKLDLPNSKRASESVLRSTFRACFSFKTTAEVVTGTSGTNFSTRRHTFCTMPEKKGFKRLPLDVKPENYNLRLQPDLLKFTFKGQETIDVKVEIIFN